MPSAAAVNAGPEKVELVGTSREVGLQHGRLLKSKIRAQVDVYDAIFQRTSKLDWQGVRAIAGTYRATIERLTPEIYTEMVGIAEGAGLDLLDIVALNCRSEIALGNFSDGCTSMAWKTEKDGVILAQNWDWTASVKDNCVFMSIEKPGKPKIYMITEAGVVGKIGFNSASVGTNLNAIRAKPTDTSKLPVHVLLRVCLESSSAAAAVTNMEILGGIASAQHILIADADVAESLELTPKGNVYLSTNESENGIVCHTNHLIRNKYVDEPPWLAGSPIRLERIEKLTSNLAMGTKPVTAEMLRRQVFSDVFNSPQAICCQEDPSRPIETRSSTLFCIIMRFQHGQEPSAEVVWGKPGSGLESAILKMPW
ncbi:MAG: hypothetical protein M1818_002778 [Claussenomyces sp. TS43310]|nr:MAG: hypothetical protein M1818_002778 [Claussenomyces sp. TS43310]